MTKSKFTLQNLLNKCDECIPMGNEYNEWDKMQPVGKEFGSEKSRGTKSIKTVEENEQALARVEELWGAVPNSPEADELDTLVTLIHTFEEENYPIATPDPIEAIRFRMEQKKSGLSKIVTHLYASGSERIQRSLEFVCTFEACNVSCSDILAG
jgi:antitoxin component HigA of HigAB toxin-antitoxin module